MAVAQDPTAVLSLSKLKSVCVDGCPSAAIPYDTLAAMMVRATQPEPALGGRGGREREVGMSHPDNGFQTYDAYCVPCLCTAYFPVQEGCQLYQLYSSTHRPGPGFGLQPEKNRPVCLTNATRTHHLSGAGERTRCRLGAACAHDGGGA